MFFKIWAYLRNSHSRMYKSFNDRISLVKKFVSEFV
jgi:hypothetical protein